MLEPLQLTRRGMLKVAALALCGTTAAAQPSAGTSDPRQKTLVILFQRGGTDGLGIVAPYGDRHYYDFRPDLALPAPSTRAEGSLLDLDGFFGLHPALAPMKTLFDRKELAVIHAVGQAHPVFTHIEAQRAIESSLVAYAPKEHRKSTRARPGLSGTAYPACSLARNLRSLAQRIKSGTAPATVLLETDGWDHHFDQAGDQPHLGRLAAMLIPFGQSLAAFHQDLGAAASNVALVTLSEFGRSVRQNTTRGTDHGHGTMMFVLGGNIHGGKVYGRWPGLRTRDLHEGRGLAVTTDYRQVLAELAAAEFGATSRTPNLDFRSRATAPSLHPFA